MRVMIAALASLWIATAAHAAAPAGDSRSVLLETANAFQPGERIRITSPPPWESRFTGWFQSVDSDSTLRIQLARSEPAVPVHLRQIGVVEASRGAKRHWLSGAAVGLLLGTLVGLAVTAGEPDPSVNLPYIGPVRMRGFRQSEGAVKGAAVGLVAGGVIGYLVRTERWSEVSRVD